jgi:GAF domain-containing protein
MAAPVFYAEKPIEILVVEIVAKEPKTYKQEEIDLLESIARQTAILLNQSRLKEEILRLNEELPLITIVTTLASIHQLTI